MELKLLTYAILLLVPSATVAGWTRGRSGRTDRGRGWYGSGSGRDYGNGWGYRGLSWRWLDWQGTGGGSSYSLGCPSGTAGWLLWCCDIPVCASGHVWAGWRWGCWPEDDLNTTCTKGMVWVGGRIGCAYMGIYCNTTTTALGNNTSSTSDGTVGALGHTSANQESGSDNNEFYSNDFAQTSEGTPSDAVEASGSNDLSFDFGMPQVGSESEWTLGEAVETPAQDFPTGLDTEPFDPLGEVLDPLGDIGINDLFPMGDTQSQSATDATGFWQPSQDSEFQLPPEDTSLLSPSADAGIDVSNEGVDYTVPGLDTEDPDADFLQPTEENDFNFSLDMLSNIAPTDDAGSAEPIAGEESAFFLDLTGSELSESSTASEAVGSIEESPSADTLDIPGLAGDEVQVMSADLTAPDGNSGQIVFDRYKNDAVANGLSPNAAGAGLQPGIELSPTEDVYLDIPPNEVFTDLAGAQSYLLSLSESRSATLFAAPTATETRPTNAPML